MKISVIDSGYPNYFRIKPTKAFRIITNKNLCSRITYDNIFDIHGHSTIIHQIIERYLEQDDEIIHVKILNEQLASHSLSLVKAIEISIDENVDLINISLGTTSDKYLESIKSVIMKALEKKIVVVCAKDNFGRISYPSDINGTICVGGGLSNNSNIFCHIIREKDEIDIEGTQELRWLNGEVFKTGTTSFWAPHVSGIIINALKNNEFPQRNSVKEIMDYLSKHCLKKIKLLA